MLLEKFISGAVIATVVCGTPILWKLGKKKKAESIANGKVYYGIIGCRILLFYVIGIVCGEKILALLFGNSVSGTIAIIMTFISGVPFAALFTYLYRKYFIKKYLSSNDDSKCEGIPCQQAHSKFCSRCGNIIDGETKVCTGCGKQYFRAKTVIPRVVIAALLILSIGLNVVQYSQGNRQNELIASQTNQIDELEKEVTSLKSTIRSQESTDSDGTDNSLTFSEWQKKEQMEASGVGIRTITFGDELTAEYVLAKIKQARTEKAVIDLMDEYGSNQGGGKLYEITPGYFVEECDRWCFDPTRQAGDCEIVENAYGYTILYFSSVL